MIIKTALTLALLSSLIACDVSTEGATGKILFTPVNCGRLSCDFDNSIGVGGTLQLRINANINEDEHGGEGVSTLGATIVSDSPDLLKINPTVGQNGQATWELHALGAGVPRLTVYSSDNEVVDFIEVPIQKVTGLISEKVFGDAVGPSSDATYDEVWTVNANADVSFQIAPTIGIKAPTMGNFVYTATVDQAIQDGLVEDRLDEGYLYFNVPVGEYLASFVNDFGHRIDILIQAE